MEIIGNADGPTSIFLSGVLGDSYKIISYTILVIFYCIYFLKQYSLKKHGIQAMQLGRNKIEILILFSSVCITFPLFWQKKINLVAFANMQRPP